MSPKHSKQLRPNENFTTIIRIEGKKKSNSTNFIENEHSMKEIQAPEVATIKM